MGVEGNLQVKDVDVIILEKLSNNYYLLFKEKSECT